MFEPHVSSTPYFVGIELGVPLFGVDTLEVNADTNEQRITTAYFSTESIMNQEYIDYLEYLYSYEPDEEAFPGCDYNVFGEEDEGLEWLSYEDEDPSDLNFDE